MIHHSRSLSFSVILSLLAFSLAARAADTLDVMTINLEHHDNPAEMKAMARSLQSMGKVPEFILCQEVYFNRSSKESPEDNTAAVLANQLGYFCKGTKRTSDREGIALISKYPFDHYDAINLKSQTLRILLGFRRVSIMGEFTVPNIGKVRVTDTHLTNWEFEGHVRRKQIAETMKWADDRNKLVPAVVNLFGGDFNAKTGWDEMKQIKDSGANGGLNYQDHNGTGFTQGSHGSPSKRIDFIFVANPASILSFVGEKLLWKEGLMNGSDHFYPSDHLGVVHTYALGAAAAPNRTASVHE